MYSLVYDGTEIAETMMLTVLLRAYALAGLLAVVAAARWAVHLV